MRAAHAQNSSLNDILSHVKITASLISQRDRTTAEAEDWDTFEADTDTAFSPDRRQNTQCQTLSEWKAWIEEVSEIGELTDRFTHTFVQSILELPSTAKEQCIEKIGQHYLSSRKQGNSGEPEGYLPPRRTLDLILSLLLNPHERFQDATQENSREPLQLLETYFGQVQHALHFNENSYGADIVRDLINKLQSELTHHVELAETIDREARKVLSRPRSPLTTISHALWQGGRALFSKGDHIPRSETTNRSEEKLLHSLESLRHLSQKTKSSFLASPPFQADNFDGYVVVTGSFPQGRCYYRGNSIYDADYDQDASIGDIDIVLPSPINRLWCNLSLESKAPWSTHPIGNTIFSTFAGDPEEIRSRMNTDNLKLEVYTAISPICFQISRTSARLVVFPFQSNDTPPLTFDL